MFGGGGAALTGGAPGTGAVRLVSMLPVVEFPPPLAVNLSIGGNTTAGDKGSS